MPPRPRKGKSAQLPAITSGPSNEDPLDWDGPFPIRSPEEIERYKKISRKSIAEPRLFDMVDITNCATKYPTSALRDVAVLNAANYFGCTRLASLRGPSVRELILEFYTTFVMTGHSFTCRLGGRELTVDEEVFERVLGLNFEGIRVALDSNIPNLSLDKYWEEIATIIPGGERYLAWDIKTDSLFYQYKFIAHVLLGKQEAHRCTQVELNLLWCIAKEIKPSIAYLVMDSMALNASHSRVKLTYGPVITALAESIGIDVRTVVNRPTFVKPVIIKLVARTQRPSYGERDANKRRRSNVGETSRAIDETEKRGNDPEAPWDGLSGIRDDVRALQVNVNERFDRVMGELANQREEHARFRNETKKDHNTIIKMLRACVCMSRSRDDDDDDMGGGDNRADFGGGNREDVDGGDIDVNREVEPEPRSTEIAEHGGAREHGENIEGETYQMRSTEYDHMLNFARFNVPSSGFEQPHDIEGSNRGTMIVYTGRGTPNENVNEFGSEFMEGSKAIFEAFNALGDGQETGEELDSGDDIESNDAQEGGSTWSTPMQVDYGRQGDDDYLDTSRPTDFEDDESDEDDE